MLPPTNCHPLSLSLILKQEADTVPKQNLSSEGNKLLLTLVFYFTFLNPETLFLTFCSKRHTPCLIRAVAIWCTVCLPAVQGC